MDVNKYLIGTANNDNSVFLFPNDIESVESAIEGSAWELLESNGIAGAGNIMLVHNRIYIRLSLGGKHSDITQEQLTQVTKNIEMCKGGSGIAVSPGFDPVIILNDKYRDGFRESKAFSKPLTLMAARDIPLVRLIDGLVEMESTPNLLTRKLFIEYGLKNKCNAVVNGTSELIEYMNDLDDLSNILATVLDGLYQKGYSLREDNGWATVNLL